MSFGYIYKIVFPNGKHYIGLTTISLERRRSQHKCCAKNINNTQYLYNALRKYEMVDTFELIEIDTADTLEELCKKENDYILDYNSYYTGGCGYNMTSGGEGTNGYVFTEEDNQKNSERQIKRYAVPGAREEHSIIMSKRFEDNPALRQQLSEIKINYFKNSEARQIVSEGLKRYNKENPNAGKEHSERLKQLHKDHPEIREKQSEKRKKYYAENQKARQQILDTKGQNKPFDVFKDGICIKTFTYQFEAIEYLRKEHHITSTILISQVLAGSRKSSAGFVFKYK